MTGKYPARLHLTDWIAGHENPYGKLLVPDWTQYLPTEEVTLAEVAKAANYATASVGKWHLGNDSIYYPQHPGLRPERGGLPPGATAELLRSLRARQRYAPPTCPKGHRANTSPTGSPKRRAGSFVSIRRSLSSCTFRTTRCTLPSRPKTSLTAYYRKKLKPGTAAFQPRVRGHDPQHRPEHGAALMQVLDSLSLSQRTTIIFTSDNGGLSFRGKVTNNAPLRGGQRLRLRRRRSGADDYQAPRQGRCKGQPVANR